MMEKRLENGFAVEVDTADETRWREITRNFLDHNIYQTRSYESVRSGEENVSHITVKRGNEVVAAAQARIVKVRPLGLGVAYIRWGPLWQLRSGKPDEQVFRQAIRAVRNEYAGRRGLVVRLIPHLPDDDKAYGRILSEEGFAWKSRARRSRTILMDIRPSLDELNKGFHQKWRNALNSARKQNLELIEGEDDELFVGFEPIYLEMKDRKQFSSSTDPTQYRQIQKKTSPDERMRVFLCKAGGEVCAGAICSALGNTGVYLFGATSSIGMKNNGSYLVQWRVLEWLKARGADWYNLNGINPEKNEGTYRFKARLAGAYGHDVHFLGQYDAYPNAAMGLVIGAGEYLKAKITEGRESLREFSAKRKPAVATVRSADEGTLSGVPSGPSSGESKNVRSGS